MLFSICYKYKDDISKADVFS